MKIENLTARDYFAAQAMIGMLGNEKNWDTELETIANMGYEMADIMIEERNKGNK